jgi:uncharacterized integral membrane protein
VKPAGWGFVAVVGVLAGLFAVLNRWERVSISLGLFRLNAVPLAVALFAAFLLGMAAMLLISLPQDRRTRDLLRSHGLIDAQERRESVDVLDS